MVRRASCSVGVFPRGALLLVVICLTDLACALARIYGSVRYVKSRVVRGSPALARGAHYVAPELVKVVVGSKLEKVSNDPSPFPSDSPSPTLTPRPFSHHIIVICFFPPSGRLPNVFTHVCTPSRNAPDKCLRQRPRRSQRARDVSSSWRRPRWWQA